jgi:hypothetical protein
MEPQAAMPKYYDASYNLLWVWAFGFELCESEERRSAKGEDREQREKEGTERERFDL